MPNKRNLNVILDFEFRVVEKGQWAYILWPWDNPTQFIYQTREAGAAYRLAIPTTLSRTTWIEFDSQEGCHGEYSRNLFFGLLSDWGWSVYRRFQARGSHYLTQHGLDGLPQVWWDAAQEYTPGVPIGQVKITFRVESKSGLFQVCMKDWGDYFVSGRNDRLSDMALSNPMKRRRSNHG